VSGLSCAWCLAELGDDAPSSDFCGEQCSIQWRRWQQLAQAPSIDPAELARLTIDPGDLERLLGGLQDTMRVMAERIARHFAAVMPVVTEVARQLGVRVVEDETPQQRALRLRQERATGPRLRRRAGHLRPTRSRR
jgi:hypothetical protein